MATKYSNMQNIGFFPLRASNGVLPFAATVKLLFLQQFAILTTSVQNISFNFPLLNCALSVNVQLQLRVNFVQTKVLLSLVGGCHISEDILAPAI